MRSSVFFPKGFYTLSFAAVTTTFLAIPVINASIKSNTFNSKNFNEIKQEVKNYIGFVKKGVSEIGNGVSLMYKKLDPVNTFSTLFDTTKNATNKTMEAFGTAQAGIKQGYEFVGKGFGTVSSFISEKSKNFGSAVSKVKEAIVNVASSTFTWLKSNFKSIVLDKIVEYADFEKLKTLITGQLSYLALLKKPFQEFLKEPFSSFINSIKIMYKVISKFVGPWGWAVIENAIDGEDFRALWKYLTTKDQAMKFFEDILKFFVRNHILLENMDHNKRKELVKLLLEKPEQVMENIEFLNTLTGKEGEKSNINLDLKSLLEKPVEQIKTLIAVKGIADASGKFLEKTIDSIGETIGEMIDDQKNGSESGSSKAIKDVAKTVGVITSEVISAAGSFFGGFISGFFKSNQSANEKPAA